MSVSMTILADRPALVAEVYNLLAEHLQTVAIEGDDVLFEFVIGDVAVEEALAEEYETAQTDELRAVTWDVTETHTRMLSDEEIVEPVEEAEEPPSLRQQITDLLNAQPDRQFTAAVVAEHVEGNAGSVAATLKWLSGHDGIRRVDRGLYQALDRTAVHDARRQAAAAGMFNA